MDKEQQEKINQILYSLEKVQYFLKNGSTKNFKKQDAIEEIHFCKIAINHLFDE